MREGEKCMWIGVLRGRIERVCRKSRLIGCVDREYFILAVCDT